MTYEEQAKTLIENKGNCFKDNDCNNCVVKHMKKIKLLPEGGLDKLCSKRIAVELAQHYLNFTLKLGKLKKVIS